MEFEEAVQVVLIYTWLSPTVSSILPGGLIHPHSVPRHLPDVSFQANEIRNLTGFLSLDGS